jgi:hypothetical protein
MDITAWLRSLGLERYEQAFRPTCRFRLDARTRKPPPDFPERRESLSTAFSATPYEPLPSPPRHPLDIYEHTRC